MGLASFELRDARKLYAKARLLLVPSVWEESAPRVVVEAQASGIPVLASDRGGLSEWVGAGGVVLPLGPDDAAWLEALDRLWHDEAFYEGLSHAARGQARRADLEEGQVLACFLAAPDVALKPAGGGSGR